jgi:hypothetical protein
MRENRHRRKRGENRQRRKRGEHRHRRIGERTDTEGRVERQTNAEERGT